MIKNIIKYISRLFFILSFLAILSPVYAAEGSYTSAKYHYCQYGASNTCYLSSSTFNKNLGTMTTFDPYDILQSFGFTFTGSYSSDNTYSVTAVAYLDYIELVTEGTSTYSAFYIFSSLIDSYTLRGCTTTGTCNNWINISPIAIASITQVDNSNYRIEINFTFKSNVDLKQVDINYIFNQDSPLYSASYLYQFRVNTIDITYEEGTSNQLLQQQIANQQATNQHLQDLQKEINDLNNNSTNNTNNIINNQQENTQDIINNQQQNTQDILDSNKETQDTINNNFNECRDSYNLFNKNGDFNFGSSLHKTTLLSNGTLLSTSNFKYGRSSGQLIENIKPNTDYTVSGILVSTVATDETRNAVVQILSSSNVIIKTNYFSSSLTKPYEFEFTFNSGNNTSFWISLNGVNSSSSDTSNIEVVFDKIQIQEGNSATKYEEYGEQVCINRIDETNDKLNDLNNSINDETPPDLSSLENSAGWLPPGPIDSVLNLPLSFLNNLSDNLGNSCQPVSLTLPYVNKDIELPCVSTIYDKIGLTPFLNWTSPIISCFILFGYLINLYKWVDDTLTLRENTHIDNWGGV